ncbi:MAG: energy transducer TonB [Bacteroidota bacterium]
MKQPIPFDNPWERLPFILPLALLIWILGLWGLGLYLERPAQLPLDSKPIEAQLLEIPPSATIQTPPTAHPKLRQKSPPPLIEPMPHPSEVIKPTQQEIPKPEVNLQETHPVVPPVQEVLPMPPAPVIPLIPLSKGGEGARVIFQPLPKIPDDLREDALHTVAVARFHVAADGTVTVELITPTPNPKLNQVLLDTLKTWRFFPAIRDGNPVTSVQDLRISVEVK